jgi:esterase/lipase superfamily enzyme
LCVYIPEFNKIYKCKEKSTGGIACFKQRHEIAVYGVSGKYALLMFPTAAADFLEYERFKLIDSLKPYVERGKIRAFSVNSINSESWLNENTAPEWKSERHKQFNEYIANEVVPFIKSLCGDDVQIITTGASFGALHAANTFFRRPDLFAGTIAMSGSYDLKDYAKGYYDDNVYFNSPVDYLSNLNDENVLNQIRHKKHIYITTGQEAMKIRGLCKSIKVLNSKGIEHQLDLWGHDIPHDWPSWRKMLPYFIETKLN